MESPMITTKAYVGGGMKMRKYILSFCFPNES